MNNILYYNVVRVVWFGFRCRWDRESLSMEAKFLSFWPRTLFRNRAFRPDQALQPRSFSFPLSQNGTRLTRIATYVGSLVALVIVEIYGVVLMWLRVYRYRTVLICICFRWHFFELTFRQILYFRGGRWYSYSFCKMHHSQISLREQQWSVQAVHSAFGIQHQIQKDFMMIVWNTQNQSTCIMKRFFVYVEFWLRIFILFMLLVDRRWCFEYFVWSVHASERASTHAYTSTVRYTKVSCGTFFTFLRLFFIFKRKAFSTLFFHVPFVRYNRTNIQQQASNKQACKQQKLQKCKQSESKKVDGGCMLHSIWLNFILTSHSTSVRSRRNNTLLFSLYLFDIHTLNYIRFQ